MRKTKSTPQNELKTTAPSPEPPAPDAADKRPLRFSRPVLEETPAKVLTFLKTAGTSTAVRGKLAANGYSDEEHALGWKLLHQASGYQPAAPAAPSTDREIQQAIAELDAWDEPNFRRIRAALTRLYPAQMEFVFSGDLKAATGIAAVVSVEEMLDRLDALAEGRTDATRAADQAAVGKLGERGYTQEERARLRALVVKAKRGTQVSVPAPVPVGEGSSDEERLNDLQELKLWYDDWAETARAVIQRRDYLIRLGLAKKRQPGSKDEEGDAGDAGDGVDTPAPDEGPAQKKVVGK